jgi:hypothetical protein
MGSDTLSLPNASEETAGSTTLTGSEEDPEDLEPLQNLSKSFQIPQRRLDS